MTHDINQFATGESPHLRDRKVLTMKFLLFSIAFLVLILAGQTLAQNNSPESNLKRTGRVTVKYDKSKDLTTVKLKQMTISKLRNERSVNDNLPLHQMDIEMWFSYSGQEPKKVDEIVMKFHAVGSNYIFLKGQQIIVALNREVRGEDKAFSLGMTDYKSSSPKFNSVYEEFMTIQVLPDAIVKISKATSAEIYVGPIGYQLTSEQQLAIAELAAMLPQPEVKKVPRDKVGAL
jgi:hypothetical protein